MWADRIRLVGSRNLDFSIIQLPFFDSSYDLSSVIRQKGESQNGCFKKTKHAKFSEKRTFLTPWYALTQHILNLPMQAKNHKNLYIWCQIKWKLSRVWFEKNGTIVKRTVSRYQQNREQSHLSGWFSSKGEI